MDKYYKFKEEAIARQKQSGTWKFIQYTDMLYIVFREEGPEIKKYADALSMTREEFISNYMKEFDYSEVMKKGPKVMAWKVYGAPGHRQKESFSPSYIYDFSDENDPIRIIEVENCDLTGTHDYSLIRIIRKTQDECIEELEGQLTDGIFENCNHGEVELWELSFT